MKKLIIASIIFWSSNSFALDNLKIDPMEDTINNSVAETTYILKRIGASQEQIKQFVDLEKKSIRATLLEDAINSSLYTDFESQQINVLGEELFRDYEVALEVNYERSIASVK